MPNWNGSLVEPPHDPQLDARVQQVLAAVRPDVADALAVHGGWVSHRMAEERGAAEQATERYQAAAAEFARHLAVPPRSGHITRVTDSQTERQERAMGLLERAREYGRSMFLPPERELYAEPTTPTESYEDAAGARRWEDIVDRNQARHAGEQAVRDVTAHEEAVRLGFANVDEAIEAGRQMEDGEYEALPDDDPRYNGPRYDVGDEDAAKDNPWGPLPAAEQAAVDQRAAELAAEEREHRAATADWLAGINHDAADAARERGDAEAEAAWRALAEDSERRAAEIRAGTSGDNDESADDLGELDDRGQTRSDNLPDEVPDDVTADATEQVHDDERDDTVGRQVMEDHLTETLGVQFGQDPDREALSAVADAGAAAAVADAREAEIAADTSGAYSGSDYTSAAADTDDDRDAHTDVA